MKNKLVLIAMIGLCSYSYSEIKELAENKSIWIDRFQTTDGLTAFKSHWFGGTDASNGGKSMILPIDLKSAIESKEANSSDKVQHIRYKLNKGTFTWDPYISWGTATKPADWAITPDSIVAIAYDYKGAAHSLIWQLSSVEDYANYQKPLAESAEWTTALIPVKNLKQPSWGRTVDKDISKTTGFLWQVMGKTGDSADVYIDNVRLIKVGGIPGEVVNPNDYIKTTPISEAQKINQSAWVKKPKFGQAKVSLWPQEKTAAFSLTFDDGLRSQYIHAKPLLDKYGYKGTFFLITGSLEKDSTQMPAWRTGWWYQFVNLAQAGHEMASHTVNHPQLNNLEAGKENDPASLTYQYTESQKTLKQYFPQTNAFSFAYPFGNCPQHVHDLAGKYYFASREIGSGLNASNPKDYNAISATTFQFPIGKPRNASSDSVQVNEFLRNVADNALKNKGWAVWLAHDVLPQDTAWKAYDTWMPASTQSFEQLLAYLKTNDSKFWVAPFGTIAKYAKERSLVKSGVLKETLGKRIEMVVDDGLDDAIFNEKIEVKVNVPQDWKRVGFVQGSNDQILEAKNGTLTLNVLPTTQPIMLLKK